MDVHSVMDRVADLIRKGNVARVVVRRKGEAVLNVPVSVAAAGAVVGLAAAKWLTLAAAVAAVGAGCTVEVVRKDGAVVNVLDEESSRKVREIAGEAAEKVMENLPLHPAARDHAEENGGKAVDAEVEEILEPIEPKRKD
ncbi:MAG: DUF4342 domain-containing protein [Oscillospiraceae bacterium]|nr:DUF4342 domain-containing protein [Oscillospiraceae bacterium]